MKTLNLTDQLGLLGWAVASSHFAPDMRERVNKLIREMVSEDFSAEFLAFLNKLPVENEYTKEMLLACSSSLIEFCHRVGTKEEFSTLMATEYGIFQEFCKLGNVTAESYEQHIKDMSPKIAQDYLATKASDMTGTVDDLSGALFRASLGAKMSELLPTIAETFVTGEFFEDGYRDKEMIYTGKDIKLVVPDKEAPSEDEWAEEFDEN